MILLGDKITLRAVNDITSMLILQFRKITAICILHELKKKSINHSYTE